MKNVKKFEWNFFKLKKKMLEKLVGKYRKIQFNTWHTTKGKTRWKKEQNPSKKTEKHKISNNKKRNLNISIACSIIIIFKIGKA